MSSIGTKSLNKIFVGDKEVQSVFIGSSKVYQSGPFIEIPTVMSINNTTDADISATLNIYKENNDETSIKLDGVEIATSTTSGTQGIAITLPIGESEITIEGGEFYFNTYCLGSVNNATLNNIQFGTNYGTQIGQNAFRNSKLTVIETPNSVIEIKSHAFDSCSNLSTIIIGNSVTTIGEYAFWACSSASTIIIGRNVTSIGLSAFCYCSNLTAFTISFGNSKYSTLNNGRLLVRDNGLLTAVALKDLTSCNIPSGVTIIGENAFYYCSDLVTVTIPNTVTVLKKYAFQDCENLTSISIPSSVTSIEEKAFDKCIGLTNLIIPASVTNIGDLVASNCGTINLKVYSLSSENRITNKSKGWLYGSNSSSKIYLSSSLTSSTAKTAFGNYFNSRSALGATFTTVYSL